MRTYRRATLAVLAAVALLTGSASASGICLDDACVDTTPVDDVVAALGGAPGGGDPGGVLCGYVKWYDPAPHDWHGAQGAPYVWTQTEAWGSQYPDDWDLQQCAPLCVQAPAPFDVELCGNDALGSPTGGRAGAAS